MIGVLGGTFDPVHFGHLRPALDVLQSLRLSELRFVPLAQPVHRRQPVASAAQRLALLRAAVSAQPGFAVDTRELDRGGLSYTCDTLAAIRREIGPQRPLCLLIGADAFAMFPRWRRPHDILQMAHLVVMQRPLGEPMEKVLNDSSLQALYRQHVADKATVLQAEPGGKILFQTVTQLRIASTQIRELLAAGLSPRYLLPEAVLDMIDRDGLYR